MPRSKHWWLARPRDLARYIALSAFLISSSGVLASPGKTATPIDGVTEIGRPSALTGTSIAASSLRATSSTSWRCCSCDGPPCSSTMNSSPPKRATRSVARRLARMRADTVRSSVSPTRWPSESLTRLKWSRSMNSSASRVPSDSAAAMWCCSCSMNDMRLGRPVSASWCARWWMRACAAWRSRMSRTMVMRMRSPLRSMVRTMNSTAMRWPCLSTTALS